MAEEPNQDMSMDDILSSIRSILMEDNAAQQDEAQPASQTQTAETLQTSEPQTVTETPEEDNINLDDVDTSILSALPDVDEQTSAAPSAAPIQAEPQLTTPNDASAAAKQEDEEDTLEEDDVFDLSPSMIIDDADDKVILENMNDSSEPEISEDDILNLSNLASSVQNETSSSQATQTVTNAPQVLDHEEDETPTKDAVPQIREVNTIQAPLAADVLMQSSETQSDSEEPFSLDDALSESENVNIEDLSNFNISEPINNTSDDAATSAPIATEQSTEDALQAEEEQRQESIKAAIPPLDFDLPKVDVDAEPIFEPESRVTTEIAPSQLKESMVATENNADDFDVQTSDSEIDSETLSAILGNQTGIKENETMTEPQSQPEVSSNAVEPEVSTLSENTSTDAADVSANIINNFAKLFAEKKNAQAQVMPETEVVEASEPIKNSSQSIAELVREAVVKQVTQQMDANFETYAKEAVAAQTQAWLDANLPAIVEAVVSKEIERVMAKVGS